MPEVMTEELFRKCCQMQAKGKTWVEVAKHYNVTIESLKYWRSGRKVQKVLKVEFVQQVRVI